MALNINSLKTADPKNAKNDLDAIFTKADENRDGVISTTERDKYVAIIPEAERQTNPLQHAFISQQISNAKIISVDNNADSLTQAEFRSVIRSVSGTQMYENSDNDIYSLDNVGAVMTPDELHIIAEGIIGKNLDDIPEKYKMLGEFTLIKALLKEIERINISAGNAAENINPRISLITNFFITSITMTNVDGVWWRQDEVGHRFRYADDGAVITPPETPRIILEK